LYRVYTIHLFSELRVLILAIYASRKEIGLLISVVGISCLFCGPIIFYAETIGYLSLKNVDSYNIDSVPTGLCVFID